MDIVTLPAVGVAKPQLFFLRPQLLAIAARGAENFSAGASRTPCWPWADSPARRRFWPRKDFGAKTFLHESNTIPGRANRFLARFVDEAFVGFPEAAARLQARKVTHDRHAGASAISSRAMPDACRAALGLDPHARPFWSWAAARARAASMK